MAEVSLQQLSDVGLNPFAIKLLVESWKNHPKPVPVQFDFDGVRITLEATPSPWTCNRCNYMNGGPICTKCGTIKPE